MKKLLVVLLATSALGLALPAMAHEHPETGYAQNDDWNTDIGGYDEFNQEYQHIWTGIQHGVNDGSYSRRQAQQFYWAMQQIKSRADWMERSGDYDSEDIQARLDRLHDRMHSAHERGHQRQDRYGYGNDRR